MQNLTDKASVTNKDNLDILLLYTVGAESISLFPKIVIF